MTTITVCSYFLTGSSAVTDLLGEFDNIKSLTDYEFRFAHDPDGLSELEYNLVENFNRHNSGHALKRYKRFVDYYSSHFLAPRYESFFHGKWKKISYEYIDSLTDFSFPGIWQFDFYDRGFWWEFWHKLPNRIIHKLHIGDAETERGLPKGEMTLASHPTEEKFLACTRNYTDSLLRAVNEDKKPYLLLDQLLPSSNIERHMRYFSDIKAVIVDRDPRDLYLQAKYLLDSRIVPSDIDLFCKWYEYARSTRNKETFDKSKILLIHFEDLIYRYEATKSVIFEFLGLERRNHARPGTLFDPDVSVKNTRLWRQNSEYSKEADYIARKLPQYLYHADGE